MKNFLNRYSFCDSSSSFFKKETYQFHIIRQTVHILFRRHLRSINISKFPNINACLVRNPLDKDTDLQGVVTCREHEKKSLVFDTFSLSLSRSSFSCKNLFLSFPRSSSTIQKTIVHGDLDGEAKEANIPEGIARKRRIARSAILARRRREDLLLCLDSFAMKCDHPGLAVVLRQPAWKSFSTWRGEMTRGRDDALFARPRGRDDVPPSEIPPPLLPFLSNNLYRT